MDTEPEWKLPQAVDSVLRQQGWSAVTDTGTAPFTSGTLTSTGAWERRPTKATPSTASFWISGSRDTCHELVLAKCILLWVKNRYPKWNPGKVNCCFPQSESYADSHSFDWGEPTNTGKCLREFADTTSEPNSRADKHRASHAHAHRGYPVPAPSAR